jgi:hypothetical protein
MDRKIGECLSRLYQQAEDGGRGTSSSWSPSVHEDPHSLLRFRMKRWKQGNGRSNFGGENGSNGQESQVYLVTSRGLRRLD